MAEFSYHPYMLPNTTQTPSRANGPHYIFDFGDIHGIAVMNLVLGGIGSLCLFCCILLLCIKYRKRVSKNEQDPPPSVEIVNGVELHYKYTSKGTVYSAQQHGSSFKREETFDRIINDKQTTVNHNPVHSPRPVAPVHNRMHDATQTVVRSPSPRNVYPPSPRDIHHNQSLRGMNHATNTNMNHSPRSPRAVNQVVIHIPRLRHADTLPTEPQHTHITHPTMTPPVHRVHNNQSPRQAMQNINPNHSKYLRNTRTQSPRNNDRNQPPTSTTISNTIYINQTTSPTPVSIPNLPSSVGPKSYPFDANVSSHNRPHRQTFPHPSYQPSNAPEDTTIAIGMRYDTESLSTVNTKYHEMARHLRPQTYAVVDTITDIVNAANGDQKKQTMHVLSLNKLNIDIAHSIGDSSVGLNLEPSVHTPTLNMDMEPSSHHSTDNEYYE